MVRDTKGRFIKGQSRNPQGRPSLAAELRFKEGIKQGARPEMVKQVIKKLYDLAQGGDVQAARTFLEYTCGKPAQTVAVTTDGQPLVPNVYLPAVQDEVG
jgi:hypothetical protein